jgi:hypothetical protein
LLRNYTLTFGQKNGWTFGGLSTYNDFSVQFKTQFTNRMDLSLAETYVFTEMNTRLLRGGPAFRLSPSWKNTLQFNTDKSRRIIFSVENASSLSTDGTTRLYSLKPGLNFRLGNHIYIITDFKYTHNIDNFLYVAQKMAGNDVRYILGNIRQQTYNFTFRFNYNVTPDLSVQYYGSPFISSGIYNDFKYASDPHSEDLGKRYHSYSVGEISYNDAEKTYYINEGSAAYSFGNPDFSFRQFRSNFVVRWEYRPGSTIYFVWENNRNSRDSFYVPYFSDNLSELFGELPTNIFMVKISYWLGL